MKGLFIMSENIKNIMGITMDKIKLIAVAGPTASGKTARAEVYTYTYDEKDRVSTVKHKLGSTEVTLASYTKIPSAVWQPRSFMEAARTS